MANNLGYTPGTGAAITTTQASSDGSQVQTVALGAIGATGDRTLLPVSATLGLGVQVLGNASGVTFAVVNPSSQSLSVNVANSSLAVTGTVAISGTVAATQSGTWNIGTVATITNPVTVTGTVAISGTVAATQSGTWNIGTLTTITNAVTVTGTVALSGTSAVSGTVTASQGTAASASGAWPAKVTDGTNVVGTQTISSKVGLNVAVIGGNGLGYSQQDGTSFTAGTTFANVDGGVYNDSLTALSSGQSGAFRTTGYRALHVNLRNNSGTEMGTSSNPFYVQASTADFPINVVEIGGEAVTMAASGVQQVGISDDAGVAFSNTNPLAVTPAPNPGTFWRQHVAWTASQTAQLIHTPVSGKTAFVQGLILTPNAAGTLAVFDETDSATTELYNGTLPSNGVFHIPFSTPVPLSAVNNLLRYNSGSGAAGDLVAWGYDA